MFGLSPGWEVTVSGLNMAQRRRENRLERLFYTRVGEPRGETGLNYPSISQIVWRLKVLAGFRMVVFVAEVLVAIMFFPLLPRKGAIR
jgi:hypothetical protein